MSDKSKSDTGEDDEVLQTFRSGGGRPSFASPGRKPRSNRADKLPPSSSDLPFSTPQLAFDAAIVYEILRRFHLQLRLSPFRFEDFCAALTYPDECGSLLNESYVSLLRLLIRDDSACGTTYCGRPSVTDGRESVTIWFYSVDAVTWPEVCRCYINALPLYDEAVEARIAVNLPNFPFVGTEHRLAVFKCLTDLVLLTQVVREELNGEKDTNPAASSSRSRTNDDVCRKCNRPGNLICCDKCSALYHSVCAEPPVSQDSPDERWLCAVCLKINVPGLRNAGDSFASSQHPGAVLRHQLIGIDKSNRHYWFVVRRLFVEEVAKESPDDVIGNGCCVAYYSAIEQVQHFIGFLGRSRNAFDKEFLESLNKWLPAITEDMQTTKDLTDQEFAQAHTLFDPPPSETVLNVDLVKHRNFESGTSLEVQLSSCFRLGDSGLFRYYENQYVVNPLALTHRQKREDGDRRRTLSNKFCVLPPNCYFDMPWKLDHLLPKGVITYSFMNLADAVRSAILSMESAIPRSHAFFMPAWLTSSLAYRWRRAVELCSSPDHFALALLILVSNLRLIAFLPVWYETGGHTRLSRVTQSERKEVKIKDQVDRRLQRKAVRQAAAACRRSAALASMDTTRHESDDSDASDSDSDEESSVKFTKKPRHSVWKQRGEEYRLSIGGGWIWTRSGRRSNNAKARGLVFVGKRYRNLSGHSTVKPFVCNNADDVVDVSSALVERTLFEAVPGTETKVLDGLLQRRLAMTGDSKEQIKALKELIDPLKQGRKLADLFPLPFFTLPDSLPACIRYFPITLETTLEQLIEMEAKLAQSTDETIRLPRRSDGSTKKCPTAPSPSIHRFTARPNSYPNIFVLSRHMVKWLARRGGFIEAIPGYIQQNSSGSSRGPAAGHAWYDGIAARPAFRTAWEYRTSLLSCGGISPPASFAAIALQIRTLAACLRFHDFVAQPPKLSSSADEAPVFTEASSDGNTTKKRELIKARLHSQEFRCYEYFCRVVTTVAKSGEETITESWIPDFLLELWEVRLFHERLSRISLQALNPSRRAANDKPKSPTTAVMRIPSPVKNAPPGQQKMQELRITQQPNGQVQITGLMSGQFMVRVPDGSFQLVSMAPMAGSRATPPPPPSYQPAMPRDRLLPSMPKLKSPPALCASPQRTGQNSSQQLKRKLDEKTELLRGIILSKRRSFVETASPPEPTAIRSPPAAVAQRTPQPAQRTPQITQPVKQPASVESPEGVANKRPRTAPKSATVSEKVIKETTSKAAAAIKSADRQRANTPTKVTKASPKENKKVQSKTPSSPSRAISAAAKATPDVKSVAPPVQEVSLPTKTDKKEDEELYCICRTPYDPLLFYIGCEDCGDWFHGSCVGVTEVEAQALDLYYCKKCARKRGVPPITFDKNKGGNAPTEEASSAVTALPETEIKAEPVKKAASPKKVTTAAVPVIESKAEPVKKAVSPKKVTTAAAPVIESDILPAEAVIKEAIPTPTPVTTPTPVVKTQEQEQGAASVEPKGRERRGRGKSAEQSAPISAQSATSDEQRQQQQAPRSTRKSTAVKNTPPSSQDEKTDNKKDESVGKRKTSKSVDNAASQGNSSAGEELYCICRTPYDETEFYIGCDGCGEWYHGACIYVAECEAKWIVRWLCQRCDPTGSSQSQILLDNNEVWHKAEQLLTALQRHKKSWPFRTPVDRNSYPLYYSVIRRPIDLSAIAAKVNERHYVSLNQFKYDVLLMFDNCRRFNPPETKFYQCADELQSFFMDRFRNVLA